VIVVAGAQKAASTTAAELISRHPRVRFEGSETLAFEGRNWARRASELMAQAQWDAEVGFVRLVKRPELFHSSILQQRVADIVDEGSVMVVVLRDPVQRTVSAARHYLSYGVSGEQSVDALIRRALHDWQRELTTRESLLIRYSMYADSVTQLLANFGDRAVIVTQDELFSKPDLVVNRALAPVGLAIEGPIVPEVLNAASSRVRPRYARVAAGLGRHAYRLRGDFLERRPVVSVIAAGWVRAVCKLAIADTRLDGHLSVDLSTELRSVFRADIERCAGHGVATEDWLT